MKKLALLLSVYFALGTVGNAAETQFIFADIKSGQAILTADDNYFNRMSKAEIAIRSQSPVANKSPHDLKNQYKANVLDWTEQEKAQITQLVADNRDKLNSLRALLPAQIIFIKVTDLVEGGLPHTRANAIVLPLTDKPLSEKLFYHELFHVLSRQQKAQHDSLYALIGFKPCDFTANDHLRTISLTNPDVPAEGYYLPVHIEGQAAAIMPMLHTARPVYDPDIEGGFGGHFAFGLLKLTLDERKCTVAAGPDGKAEFLNPTTVTDFFAAIGHNTGYIIHPEEVLADNFVFVMMDKKDLPNPEIPARLKTWLGIE
ncbi:MAG: hypothetical protein JKY91_05095 [Emcibacter sp.]|nr:hypothetical protein [Emcibacter sp.]